MIFLLSPAKRLDFETPIRATVRKRATEPLHAERAAVLIERLVQLAPSQVAQLMDLSDDLVQLNLARWRAWQPQATPHNSRPAVLAFDGDVYGGLQAPAMSTAELDWAQRHVLILSGLYGVLRPMDRLQPYRLEMGTRLANPAGADLYAYWGDLIARHLGQALADEARPVVVNLASQEYFRAVDRHALRARVIDCVFEDWKDGQYKVISFFAKRARGLLCRWAVQQRLASPRRLPQFADEGYAFDSAASLPDRLVFRRRQA